MSICLFTPEPNPRKGVMEDIERICEGIVELIIDKITTTQSETADNEAGQTAEDEIITRRTLFYVQSNNKITPIFTKQPPYPTKGKVIIHCVRHAEAQHNVKSSPNRWTITDPSLTALGMKQAIDLRATFTPMNNITHILASPLRRTIGTALLAFQALISQGLKIVAYPDLREIGKGPCSTGTKVPEILEVMPVQHHITDFSLVPEGWEVNSKDSRAEHRLRACRVRRDLWELGQQALKESGGKWKGHDVSRGATHSNIEILVVSHGGFLMRMLGLKSETFWNADWKSYEFMDENDEDFKAENRCILVETIESKKRVHNPIKNNSGRTRTSFDGA